MRDAPQDDESETLQALGLHEEVVRGSGLIRLADEARSVRRALENPMTEIVNDIAAARRAFENPMIELVNEMTAAKRALESPLSKVILASSQVTSRFNELHSILASSQVNEVTRAFNEAREAIALTRWPVDAISALHEARGIELSPPSQMSEPMLSEALVDGLGLGDDLIVCATVVRFDRGRPTTNTERLLDLIGDSAIEIVVDMYFDELAAQRLLVFGRLGARFGRRFRVLTSARSGARLTPIYVRDVMTELGIANWQIRAEAYTGHDGRLLFLSGGHVVALGVSLNNLDANERPSKARDHGERIKFEQRWAKAIPVVL